MTTKTRILLQVGDYSSAHNYSVIGEPSKFYLWHKLPHAKGKSSDWFQGPDAFKHFSKMRDLLQINKNKDAFVSYLSDLFHTNVEVAA